MTNNQRISFKPASQHDLDDLAAIRIEAMRESLERIGRFDPDRARERFSNSFSHEHTQHILSGTERIGFLVVKPQTGYLLLDHLYIRPAWQGRGIGSGVLEHVFDQANQQRLPVRVGALRDSDSNRFYIRHGFTLIEATQFDNYYIRPFIADASV